MKRSAPWILVGMLWMVCFFNYADRQAIFSIFPLLQRELGLSTIRLGVVASSFMWMYALAGPFAGWVSDRISPRNVILGALGFWSFMTAATALCHTYVSLVIVRALGGLGEAFYFPAAMVLIASCHGPDTRSRAMSLHQSGVYAGTIAGGALSAVLAEHYGWRISFLWFGAAGIGLALVLLRFLPRQQPSATPSHSDAWLAEFLSGARSAFHSWRTVLMIAVFMGANFVAFVFLTWTPTFLFTKFHLGLGSAGFSSTAYIQIASTVGVLVGGAAADCFAALRPGGRQAVQAAGLLFGAPFLFFVGRSLTLPGIIVSMIGFGLFKGIYDANIWASLYDVVPVEHRGVTAGIMNSFGWLGGGIAPVVIAAASQRFGMSVCLSATCVIYLVLAAALLYLSRSIAAKPSFAITSSSQA